VLAQWLIIHFYSFTVAGAASELTEALLLLHRLPDYSFARKAKGHLYYGANSKPLVACMSKRKDYSGSAKLWVFMIW
jgi:hypothetical protein